MNLPLRRMIRVFVLVVALIFSGIVRFAPGAMAATNLAKQPAIDVNVALGNDGGALQFFPADLEFEPGRRYNLHLSNPSSQKHYFTAKDFADGIWSQKVDAGNVEIKGAIHELELRANTKADWVFVPLRSGTYSLRCTVPGHTEAGMVGTIKVLG
ncbi:MAG: biphenyl 2,3-dioxygenase [Acaryochloridaceae cyanobacterium SU_2_1]|nr:biphenyl 2,3-dioxygenase [Acaryochloridaceae cyanobacterium SU_2_1]